MKFKYTIQPYQTEAVDSVVRVFAGQPFNNQFTYQMDVEIEHDITNWNVLDEDLYTGFANSEVQLDSIQLLNNIQGIQMQNNINLSTTLSTGGLGACSLDVEMETGTGKTYVYIKTIFELNKQFGWTKFIIVVPSIAIREGVKKSFETTLDHFMECYKKKPRFFVYDSKNLTEIDNFSQSANINVMIINIQAFNSDPKSEAEKRIDMVLDEFGSRKPIDVIKANHPILILDEPQKMGGDTTQNSLKKFNPLFCLNYSATHKQHHNLVYVLDALDAYNKRLVKRIEVIGFDIKNLIGTDSYLYLENIVLSPNKPPRARLEFEISYNKSIKRETRIVGVDDDLFVLSKNMEQYRGYHISNIDSHRGTVSFTNGIELQSGEWVGNNSESDYLRRVQIRETIRSHFEKEEELFALGIKTLSLFFIDEVAKYRKYDESGNEINSEYGEMFEQEYKNILNEYLSAPDSPYKQYLQNIEVSNTHAGYFSIDKNGHKVDSSSLKKYYYESKDISAYDLILKDKERLLSFDNPVRFIFSHSALREGWDNPNVFQICTLKHGGSSAVQKRQEVGRGLRLCVNQNGDRMDSDVLGSLVQQINKLTVIASDGYKDFVSDLQKGIREDLYDRPTKASYEYFIGKTISLGDKEVTITEIQGKDIYSYLIKNNYVDSDYHISDKYRADLLNGTLAPIYPMYESCKGIEEGVHILIQSIFDERVFDDMIIDGHKPKLQENPLNDNFYKKEFQTLWHNINHKYSYSVEFDSDELVCKAISYLNDNLTVAKLKYVVTVGEQENKLTSDKLTSGTGFVSERSLEDFLEHSEGSPVSYDLVGEIAKGARLTRRTTVRILAGLKPSVFEMFKENPEEFISKAGRYINEQKATMIVEHISYNRLDGTYDSSIFTKEKNKDFSRAFKARKNVQDYVFVDGYAKDGQSIERRFAEDMDVAEEVCVYAKLPKGFKIPTPVGNYSPDWAIAFNKGMVKHIYFIAETKGSMDTSDLRHIETAKINCASKLFEGLSTFDVVYHQVSSYQELLTVMEKL